MTTRRLALLIAALAVIATLAGPRAQSRDPLVILISFDGWRWDYTDRGNVPNLKALAARGVRAKELIPSFPSLTFPNGSGRPMYILDDREAVRELL